MFKGSARIAPMLHRETAHPLRRAAVVLTAAATALALMTATALPAHADRASDNLAKALVAALAIGAIVNSVDKGRAHAAPPYAPVHQPPREVRSPRVPSVCAIEISGARRAVTVYPERCLRREGFDARLPRQCAHEARVFGRTDRVYGEDCLRDAGLRVGGHNRYPEPGRDRISGRDDGRWDQGRGRFDR
ncbi:MAG: hypothetical protein JXR75_14930 [Rhodobacteraceae bacterium]|nr:hypothetical protein [Paracoccaceae bacterium]